MTVIVDTTPIVAAADTSDRQNARAAAFLESYSGPFILPAPISAEIDYLLTARVGNNAQRRFLADLSAGSFTVECLEPEDYALILEYDRRYAALNLGLADLSVIALAYRHRTTRILTFDERHFRAIEPIQGGTFELLPA